MVTATYVQIHFHNAHMKKRALILHAVDAASQCHMKILIRPVNTYVVVFALSVFQHMDIVKLYV